MMNIIQILQNAVHLFPQIFKYELSINQTVYSQYNNIYLECRTQTHTYA